MNKLLGDKLAKEKLTIKNRYLAGEFVPSIAKDYGVTERNIYYHLGKLSPEDKGLHIKNSSLRGMVGKEVPVQTTSSSESRTTDQPVEQVVTEPCFAFNGMVDDPKFCRVCGFEYQTHIDKIKEGLSHA